MQTLSLFPELEADIGIRTNTTGILHDRQIERLLAAGLIKSSQPVDDGQIQPASIDLRLGPVAYQVRASFLPNAATVLSKVAELKLHELDLTKPAVLEKGCVYIVPLMEELELPGDTSAKANPKSTIGRIDLFSRLISDYGSELERVVAGYRGKLYVEVAPRAFSVLVHEGTRLNQLRFTRGHPLPYDGPLEELHLTQQLIYTEDDTPGKAYIQDGLWVSVDLAGSGEAAIVGYLARRHAPLIDLDLVDHYDPAEFWDPIQRPTKRQLILSPGEFYILASKERIRIPPGFAAEMVGYDPSVGEFRIHYAGFFDPGFGYGSDDVKGSRAVLEVRSHEVPFLLKDGQRVGRFIYERLMGVPKRIYGPALGSSYQRQELALSKQFKRNR
jgi:dCTP deaminase